MLILKQNFSFLYALKPRTFHGKQKIKTCPCVVFFFSKAVRNCKPREEEKEKEGGDEKRRALDTKEKSGLSHERQTT